MNSAASQAFISLCVPLSPGPIESGELRFVQGKAELLVAHAQALARDFADNSGRAPERRFILDQRRERPSAAVFVPDLIEQDFVKNLAILPSIPRFLEFAANLVERPAASLGKRDRGALELLDLCV